MNATELNLKISEHCKAIGLAGNAYLLEVCKFLRREKSDEGIMRPIEEKLGISEAMAYDFRVKFLAEMAAFHETFT